MVNVATCVASCVVSSNPSYPLCSLGDTEQVIKFSSSAKWGATEHQCTKEWEVLGIVPGTLCAPDKGWLR